MKKLLLMYLLFTGLEAFAQEEDHHDEIVEAVVARNNATNTTIIGQMYFFKDQLGKKSALSGILFAEEDNHGTIDVTGAVGPARSTENIAYGVMVGGAVSTNNLSLCAAPWVYAQTRNRKESLLVIAMMQKEGVTFMIEGLLCVYTWKEIEIACGGINIRDYFGPYLRFSSGSMYFGINVGFKCLPNTSFSRHEEKESTSDIKIHPTTDGNNGQFVQCTFGKEIFSPRNGNRCKDCN